MRYNIYMHIYVATRWRWTRTRRSAFGVARQAQP
jgi:hypothetical protein